MAKNQEYLKSWDDYQAERGVDRYGYTPILLPIHIDINEKGEIARHRMTAGDVKKLYKASRREFPAWMTKAHFACANPGDVFKDYVEYFSPIDGVEGPRPASPLDLTVNRPVWNLFNLPRKNWKFSKNKQYSVENDPDDMMRNFEKICTLDNNNAVLISNRCRSNPKSLKYNLHITISQREARRLYRTDIIIDPMQDNDPDGGG